MKFDEVKLAAALVSQLQFVRDGYNFYGEELDCSVDFEKKISFEILQRIKLFGGMSELEHFVEHFCAVYTDLDQNYLRAVKKQIPYAVGLCLL